jgi:hypothetical protein
VFAPVTDLPFAQAVTDFDFSKMVDTGEKGREINT